MNRETCDSTPYGLLLLLLLPPAMAVHALVAKYLWVLFAVPLGAPSIGLLHVWGLGVFATYMAGGGLSLVDADMWVTDAGRARYLSLYRLLASTGGSGAIALVVWIMVSIFGPVTP